MLEKPDIDDRVKTRLFIVIKDINESIMKLVSQGDAIDDTITFMKEKISEAIGHMNIIKREEQNNYNKKMSKTEQSLANR